MSAGASPAESPTTETPGTPSSVPAGTWPSLTASLIQDVDLALYHQQTAAPPMQLRPSWLPLYCSSFCLLHHMLQPSLCPPEFSSYHQPATGYIYEIHSGSGSEAQFCEIRLILTELVLLLFLVHVLSYSFPDLLYGST